MIFQLFCILKAAGKWKGVIKIQGGDFSECRAQNARRVFNLISYYNVKNILLQIQNVEMCEFFCCRF